MATNAVTSSGAAPRVAVSRAAQAMADLVQALRDPACYPHPADAVEVIETHISYVLLAGEFAYKLKKPVRLPFLDFSTAMARRHYCEEEVRLNRRTAPQLYLGVVTVAGGRERPHIGSGEPVLEHAVKMRRVPQDALLAALARSGRLEGAHVDALAEAVAALHAGAGRAGAPASDFAARAGAAAFANFSELARLGLGRAERERLEALERWTRFEARSLAGAFAVRAAGGFVRECHGDLHLGNAVLVDGSPLPFDAIEFSPDLRWIDVASDVAFTAMDLERHGLPNLAARFVDRWLGRSGDYGALAVLRFYEVYRAMVRAKVAAIALGQLPPGSAPARARHEELFAYVEVAERLARRGAALMVVMHGVSGSGKTTVAARLVEALRGVRVRSDVERKRLQGLAPEARAQAAPGQGIYGERGTRATYDRLAEIARAVIASGRPVIVDATFMRRAERERFRELAREAGAQLRIVACTAPQAVLRARVEARLRAGSDASDAGMAVLERQLAAVEPPADDEHPFVLDTTAAASDASVDALAARLLAA